jgi:hypothetical protein
MGHADDDQVDAVLAAIFDDRLERRDHRLAAVEAETLGADIFAGEELLPLLGLDHLGQDRLLALGGEGDARALALHPLLQEAALGQVVDVHIFQADMAAIIGAQISTISATVAVSKPSAPPRKIGRLLLGRGRGIRG